jgi:hypothetical protein
MKNCNLLWQIGAGALHFDKFTTNKKLVRSKFCA